MAATQGLSEELEDVKMLEVDVGKSYIDDKRWGQLISLNPQYKDIDLIDTEVLIGRKSECQVRFTEKFISKVHCKLFFEKVDPTAKDSPTLAYLEDLSSNGTFVDGQKVGQGKKVIIRDSAEISLLKDKDPSSSPIAFLFKHFERSQLVDTSTDLFKIYTLGDVLGQGNFATVKLATNKQNGKKFACKIIDKKKYLKQAGSRKDKLMDEVEILKKIEHPGVIKIENVYDTEKTLYIVLELVTGGELFDAINDAGHFSEEVAKDYFVQLLNVVGFLHDKGIVHRDLKPENILFATKEKKQLKLSDFGLSRVIGEGSVMQTMCGTPQYIAPEILNNTDHKGYGYLVDCWSLGVILYVLLSGTLPFDDTNLSTTVFDQIRAGKVTFSASTWDDVSIEAKDLIKCFLSSDVEKRYDCKKALKHPWITGQGMEDLIEQRKKEEQASKKKKQEEESKKKKQEEDKVKIEVEKKLKEVADKKRKREEDETDEDSRPMCKYGASCYRKNVQHLQEFRHPSKPASTINNSSSLKASGISKQQEHGEGHDSPSDSGSNPNLQL